MDPTLRALNRFGLGARIGERRRMSDPRGWLRAQLEGAPPGLAAPDVAAPAAIGDALRALRMAGPGGESDRRSLRQRLIGIALAEQRAALTMRAVSERPFVERLIAFWSNHLCVSAAAKLLVAPLAGSYERDVIRPHVLGRFEDMLLASTQHPAMLLYLDNFQSIGPNSRAARLGRRAGTARGLNENYARELLELHTLGVNGGYSQQDVQELAKILTGWTVVGLGGRGAERMMALGRRRRAQVEESASPTTSIGPITFGFQELLHEPGAKTVLGTRYGESGREEGERVIRALCRHPSTSRFVATKLATHFIADDPPPVAVDRLARAFRDSNGDLLVVSRTLIDVPEAWSAENRKFRTPQDWLVAVLRAFGAQDVNDAAPVLLRQLRHPLWSPQAPKGFGDTMQEWADPDSLLNRAELSRTIARRVGARTPNPETLLDVVDVRAADPFRSLVADNSVPEAERVALAIAGPAFQWR